MSLKLSSRAPQISALPIVKRVGGDLVLPDVDGWHDLARKRLTLIDPATEAARATLPLARQPEVDQAVIKARHWLATADQPDALAILGRLIHELESRREELARAISIDIGAPIDFARTKQVDAACDHLRAFLNAGKVAAVSSQSMPERHAVVYQPAGIAALITPWNWPLNQVALKVGAALVAGCAMILKPSELSTAAALVFADAMKAAGVAPGQFTVLVGDGATGAALCAHPGVDIISFTGSTSTGRAIASAAGANLVPVLLELGGKSANILFEDCDPVLAVRQGVAHCFRNTGQSCNAASRMLVARPIYDRVVALAAEDAEQYQMGAPDKTGDHLGPLVSQAQFDRVQHHIDMALSDGARLVVGGAGRDPAMARGFYPRPTIFADVTPDMRLFHNEVFGPVLSITPFDDEDDALRLANATEFGLAGYIQTTDPDRQRRIATDLHVGMVQINGSSRAEGAPFGGVGKSGFGREAGLWGIRAFQVVKSISGLDPR